MLKLDLAAPPLYAVAAPLPAPAALPAELLVRIPDEVEKQVQPGVPIIIAHAGNELLAYVLEITECADPPPRLPRFIRIADPLPLCAAPQIEMLRRMAEELVQPFSRILTLAVPERHGQSVEPVVELAAWPDSYPGRTGLITRRALDRLHALLRAAGGRMARIELKEWRAGPGAASAWQKASKAGWVRTSFDLCAPQIRSRVLQAVEISSAGAEAVEANALTRLGPLQSWILEQLMLASDPLLVSELERERTGSRSALQSLARRGIVRLFDLPQLRVPRAAASSPSTPPPLYPEQAAAADAVGRAVEAGEQRTYLLHGVTGSGKTEVYLHAIQAARSAGRSALLLAPEISLTAQLSALVRSRFGSGPAIIHSSLSAGERFDEWMRIRAGATDLVIGARSALFAPLSRLGLIILDEEHDGSYKQTLGGPRYHARRCAEILARSAGAVLLLGSATPSVETYHRAAEGEIDLLQLPQRVEKRPMPQVSLIDMRSEMKAGLRTPISPPLQQALKEELAAGRQSILFLNRRGYAGFLLCRECGQAPRCAHCSVTLTLHRKPFPHLLCHQCGFAGPAAEACGSCGSSQVRSYGPGTQQLHEALTELLPSARILRLDRDTMQTRHAHLEVIEAMRDGRADLLVGTQMVTKGFDFPRVTLVGVIDADVGLNQPDFRSGERTFQLLTQVAGRSGRAEHPGRVLIQTFNPQHPAVALAAGHDYAAFCKSELDLRLEMNNPPYSHLARLLVSAASTEAARDRLISAEQEAAARAPALGVDLRGPAPCTIEKIRDRFRWQLILRAKRRENLVALLQELLPALRRRGIEPSLDLDPVDFN